MRAYLQRNCAKEKIIIFSSNFFGVYLAAESTQPKAGTNEEFSRRYQFRKIYSKLLFTEVILLSGKTDHQPTTDRMERVAQY